MRQAAVFSLVIAGGGTTANVALFPECQRFVQTTRQLVADAQKICQTGPGSDALTPPPEAPSRFLRIRLSADFITSSECVHALQEGSERD